MITGGDRKRIASAMHDAGVPQRQIDVVMASLADQPKSGAALRKARQRSKSVTVTPPVTVTPVTVTAQPIEMSSRRDSHAPVTVTAQPIENIESVTVTPSAPAKPLFIGKSIISSLRSDKKDIGHSSDDALAILTTVLSAETAQGVIEQRRKSKNPLTPLAAKGLVREFAKCPDPNAAAEYWANRAWRGFKAEWMNDPQQRNGHTLREDYLERHSVVAAGKRLLQQCAEGFELFEGEGAEIRDGPGRLLSKG